MRICFIGHTKHKATKSSQFFLDIIKQDANVECYYFDESNYSALSQLYTQSFDLVICWQYDFCALSFIARGYATVVVPMYDGSEGHAIQHWKLIKEARVLNFSYTLHNLCQRNGIDSLYAKYFPNPEIYEQVCFDEYRAFLWQRRPNIFNWRTVNNIVLKDQSESLHIHDAPDDASLSGQVPTEREQEIYNIKVSNWFHDKDELDSAISACNIYFAPRMSEGIGMSFLEAMARGMLVIANDMPTHNEYMSNWVNGVLYDMTNPVFVNLGRAEEIGKRARETCFEGYGNWVNQIDIIKDFVLSTPKPRCSFNSVWLPIIDKMPEWFFLGKNYNKRVSHIYKGVSRNIGIK